MNGGSNASIWALAISGAVTIHIALASLLLALPAERKANRQPVEIRIDSIPTGSVATPEPMRAATPSLTDQIAAAAASPEAMAAVDVQAMALDASRPGQAALDPADNADELAEARDDSGRLSATNDNTEIAAVTDAEQAGQAGFDGQDLAPQEQSSLPLESAPQTAPALSAANAEAEVASARPDTQPVEAERAPEAALEPARDTVASARTTQSDSRAADTAAPSGQTLAAIAGETETPESPTSAQALDAMRTPQPAESAVEPTVAVIAPGREAQRPALAPTAAPARPAETVTDLRPTLPATAPVAVSPSDSSMAVAPRAPDARPAVDEPVAIAAANSATPGIAPVSQPSEPSQALSAAPSPLAPVSSTLAPVRPNSAAPQVIAETNAGTVSPVASGSGSTVSSPAPGPAASAVGSGSSAPIAETGSAGVEVAAVPMPAKPATPSDSAGVRASEAYSRVLRFLARRESGGCFVALPSARTDGTIGIDGFAASSGLARQFGVEFSQATGVAAQMNVAAVSAPQCRALSFARNVQNYPAFTLYFEMETRSIESGDTLNGRIMNVHSRPVHLLLVDDEGIVQKVDDFIRRRGTHAKFSAPMTLIGKPVDTVELLVAITSQVELQTLEDFNGAPADEYFAALTEEIARTNQVIDLAVVAFTVR